jgi:hypothetical protein
MMRTSKDKSPLHMVEGPHNEILPCEGVSVKEASHMSTGDLVRVDGEYATIVKISESYVKVKFCNGREESYKKSDIDEL